MTQSSAVYDLWVAVPYSDMIALFALRRLPSIAGGV
jgi:hypothetical protein